MSEAESASFWAAERTGHRPSWTFGAASSAPLSSQARRTHTHERASPGSGPKLRRTRLQLRSFEALNLPAEADPQTVRERYAHLVKICHPDSNGGDRSMEDRLASVIKAFKILKNARLA